MKESVSLILITIAFIVGSFNSALGQEKDPNLIFARVMATYKSMLTYQAEGRVNSEVDTSSGPIPTTTVFSMQLKKPNFYKISWVQKIGMGIQHNGAVWNNGDHPSLYIGSMNAYSRIEDDLSAIASATGISGGAAFNIPSLFFSILQSQQSLLRIIDPKLEKIESVHGEECYVISGRSTLSQRETYWISKERYLIRQYSRTMVMTGKEFYTKENTGLDFDTVLKDLGISLTKENQQELVRIMREEEEYMKTGKATSTLTEVHEKISLNQLAPEDFHFQVPPGTKFKEKLF